uniref:FYVE, RhoGEF and PH domain containing 5a n=1 Tax=Esox lucius TaxID=8010 RepID=A0AAY5KK26_ESOLU
MNETDVADDIDADGCYAGEALADTDELSVCDLFIPGVEEEAACHPCESGPGEEENEEVACHPYESGPGEEEIEEEGARHPCESGPGEEEIEEEAACHPYESGPGEEEIEEETSEFFPSQNNNQPRFRLVSISMPADADTSQASLSDSQLLSPDSSDVTLDEQDLDGHIVPYLDESTDTEDNLSDEHVYEEAGFDSEGENVLHFGRKSIVTRSRSLSGKVPGYVPETVLEEAGSEFHLQNYCVVGLNQSGPSLSSSPMLNSARGKSLRKPHRFLLYPRSFSMEGRDLPLCVYREDQVSQGVMGLDSLSLPSVMGSSRSFSQQSPVPSSGLSTPTSVVDIPPPFELAYITKKPITKSSPSLFIEGDSQDRQKKKKSSFKRFLMLKFRRKTESKLQVDVSIPSSSHHVLDLDKHSVASSPQPLSRVSKPQRSPDSPSTFLFYKDGKRKRASVAFLNRGVARVESFEERSHAPFTPLPLTKPRSISFPNADTSDYENIPAQTLSSDYENVQIPTRGPVRPGNFAGFFDHPSRVLSSANETDGYVDMSSFPGFESKAQSPEQEPESFLTARMGKPLCLRQDFREAVGAAVGEEGDPVLEEERLREILNELPDVYTLHRRILTELENRIRQDESQRIADVILSRKSEFVVFTTYIGHYDRSMSLLDDSCRTSPAFLDIVRHVFSTQVFVKEGTLMKVSRKCRQPRHLFLMNDVLLYTYPQQDGKYRLKNTLPLTGMKVSLHCLPPVSILVTDSVLAVLGVSLCSSCSEREDWFHTLSRVVSDHARGAGTFSSSPGEAREHLWLPLGEKAPTLVPVSHVMMCMNCTSDFSLTLRRHHCHACGRIVCRGCSRNRYPLKYLKDRMAKVCDHCYSELKKRGVSIGGDVSGSTGTDSPRSNRRSSRPLSAVFQNIHPPSLWRHRKGTASLTQEKVASESLPLLGFTVKLPDRPGGEEMANMFELYHKKTLYYTFKAEDNHTAKRWVNAMEEATVL